MTKRIKILFTIPNFDTAGSGKVVYDLVKGLDKTQFAPEICCVHNRGAFFETVNSLGIPIHLFPFSTPYRPWLTFPFRVLKISRFFKQHQFDLIHSWHWSSDFSEPLAAKWAGTPFIYTKKAMGWGNKAWTWRTQLSTKVIAINKDMMQGFLASYGDKVKYIPLGVDAEIFKPLPKTRIIPNGIEFKTDDFVIVSIANLAPVKGIEILLEAVKRLDNPNIKVLIVGDHNNNYGEELMRQYKQRNVFFIDKQLDVRPYLVVADLFVIPTKDEGRKEGLPIAPLEAMAMGRIVIGSNIAGIKDILSDYKQLIFEPHNIESLANSIFKIYSLDSIEKSVLENKMVSKIHLNYLLKDCIIKHEVLYKELT